MMALLKGERGQSLVELTIVLFLAEIWLWSSASAVLYRAFAAVAIGCIVTGRLLRRDNDVWMSTTPSWDARSTWIAVITLTFLLAAGMALGMMAVYAEGEQWRLGRLERLLEPKVLADKILIVGLQQVLLCWYVLPALRKSIGNGRAALGVTAIIFGSFHLPSVLLASLAAVMAAIWLLIFERSRRLSPLILSHFILAITAAVVFPERLTYNLAVGRKAMPIAQEYRLLGEGELAGKYREWKSDQYYEKNGGSDCAFIVALYRDVLHRRATGAEIANWVRTLQRSSRADAVAKFMNSKEYSELQCKLTGACG